MTCREKHLSLHPNTPDWKFGENGDICPHDFDYLDEPENCGGADEISCTKCWDREIPEKQIAYYPRHPLKANTLDYEAEYKKLKTEQEEYRAKVLCLQHDLEQKQHEIDILRGMLRVVEAMTGSSIITAKPIGG